LNTASDSSLPQAIGPLLSRLEALSRERPDRVLRLEGHWPSNERFELLIYRGFSSSTTHPTAPDPDQAALPEGSQITSATLLQGPLTPGAEIVRAGPAAVQTFLAAEGWL